MKARMANAANRLSFGQRWDRDHGRALGAAKRRTGNGLVWVPPTIGRPSLRSREAKRVTSILAEAGIEIDSVYMNHIVTTVLAVEVAYQRGLRDARTQGGA